MRSVQGHNGEHFPEYLCTLVFPFMSLEDLGMTDKLEKIGMTLFVLGEPLVLRSASAFDR
jgi:hypothetical protein